MICLLMAYVIGCSRVPDPPARIIPFINSSFFWAPPGYVHKLIIKYTTAASKALTGMVNIQAHSRLIVTPHLTAERRLVAPTPMIDPVMVCVVLTGMPSFSVRNKVNAPAVSALTPSSGVTLVILVPMVFTIFHPPLMVPSPMAVKQANGTQLG